MRAIGPGAGASGAVIGPWKAPDVGTPALPTPWHRVLREHVAKGSECPRRGAFHGAWGTAEPGGDLGLGEVFVVTQQQDFTLPGGQTVESLTYQLPVVDGIRPGLLDQFGHVPNRDPCAPFPPSGAASVDNDLADVGLLAPTFLPGHALPCTHRFYQR